MPDALPCQHDPARVNTLLYGLENLSSIWNHKFVVVTRWSVHNASDHPFMRQTGQVAHCHLLNAQKMKIPNHNDQGEPFGIKHENTGTFVCSSSWTHKSTSLKIHCFQLQSVSPFNTQLWFLRLRPCPSMRSWHTSSHRGGVETLW